jgi:hypothetical protein
VLLYRWERKPYASADEYVRRRNRCLGVLHTNMLKR